MASLIEELITVLEEENEEYKKLMVLSKEKTPVIVKGNTEKLKEITGMEQEHIQVLNSLEKRRIEVIKDMALVLNKKEEELTVKTIVGLLEGQDKERKKLAEVHDSLKQTLDNISVINDMNKNLITSSLEMVEFNINMYKSMYQAPETGNYDKNAYNTESTISYGVFEAKN